MFSLPQVFSIAFLAFLPSNAFGFTSSLWNSAVGTRSPTQICSSSELNDDFSLSRRSFIDYAGASILAVALNPLPNKVLAADFSGKKVLVLGGTGFVGSEVCKQLKALGVDYIATSTDGRDGTEAFDVIDPAVNVAEQVEKLSNGCSAVISCIGSIGSVDDKKINSASGTASVGAKKAGVKNFVYISVAPEVRESTSGITALSDYMQGKTFSEETIEKIFDDTGSTFTIIQPTFIYGGDKFSLRPPRVAEGYGNFVESALSLGPIRAAAQISPGFIGVALKPPVNVSAVSKASIAGAFGLSAPMLDTHDKINSAANLL